MQTIQTPKICQTLIDKRADIGAKDDNGCTALIWAAIKGHGDICQTLIDKGADIGAKDKNGATALIYAARGGHNDVCQTLIDKGADIEAKNGRRNTVLISAAMNGHNDVCQMLIEKGADIDAKGQDGLTALIWAASMGHSDTCLKLIAKGADIEAKDNDDGTALIGAKRFGREDTGKWLLRYGAAHDGSSELITQWHAEMAEAAEVAFPGNGAEILATACLSGGKISEAILDACATGQFGTLVAAPLIKSTKPADRQLFKEVWDKLPRYWQDQYETLYVEFIKAGGMKPFIGKYTPGQHNGSNAGMGRS